MARRKPAWFGGALALAALLLGLSSGPLHAAPAATLSTCSFTPGRGGPGTVVHVYVSQWFNGAPSVAFGFAVPRTPGAQPAANITAESLAPLDPPLAVVPLTLGAGDATFAVPARLSTGAPIPQHDLYLMCRDNGQVAGDARGGANPFTFIPAPLPAAGSPGSRPAVPLLLLGLLLVLGGALVTVRPTRPRHRPQRRSEE